MSSYVKPFMRQGLENSELTLVQGGEVTAYRLAAPGSRLATLMFTPTRTAILGYFGGGGQNGFTSVGGYGLKWFSGKMSEDYLCEKFLQKKWLRSIAYAELTDPESWLREERDAETIEHLEDIARLLDDHGEEWLYNELSSLEYDLADGLPGWGYDPAEAGWLCAIQQRFRELYADLQKDVALFTLTTGDVFEYAGSAFVLDSQIGCHCAVRYIDPEHHNFLKSIPFDASTRVRLAGRLGGRKADA